MASVWFENYLNNRRQYIELYGMILTYEVPQGPILGPILFYVNDIHKCTCWIFADDATIMSSSNDIKGLYNEMNFELC